jgi:hypothetical protein
MHLVLSYWGRMLFAALLLSVLKATPSTARVVSILRAGQERPNLNVDDLDIKNSASKSAHLDDYAAAAETMNTLFLERLAQQNPDVVFVHKFPGLVRTTLFGQGWGQSWSAKRVIFTYIIPQVVNIVGMSHSEVGQRCVFTMLSGKYGGAGVCTENDVALHNSMGGSRREGVFLVKEDDEEAVKFDVLDGLRKRGVAQRVYDETNQVLRPYLHSDI